MFPGCYTFQSDAANCVLAEGECVGSGDCCGGHCVSNTCDGSRYPNGYYCTHPEDCLSNACDMTNTCVCSDIGQECISGPECCSGFCDLDNQTCGPCMGGNPCSSDSDCCGGRTCTPDGSICV